MSSNRREDKVRSIYLSEGVKMEFDNTKSYEEFVRYHVPNTLQRRIAGSKRAAQFQKAHGSAPPPAPDSNQVLHGTATELVVDGDALEEPRMGRPSAATGPPPNPSDPTKNTQDGIPPPPIPFPDEIVDEGLIAEDMAMADEENAMKT